MTSYSPLLQRINSKMTVIIPRLLTVKNALLIWEVNKNYGGKSLHTHHRSYLSA